MYQAQTEKGPARGKKKGSLDLKPNLNRKPNLELDRLSSPVAGAGRYLAAGVGSR